MTSPITARLLALSLLIFPAACGDDKDITPPPPPPPPPVQVPSMNQFGMGRVNERFTSELWVRGSTAYTSTWGRRDPGQIPGNAVKIWDVSGGTPILVDSLIIANATTTGDIQVSDDGSLLVVATERTGGSIVIYDLTNPRAPRELSRFTSANTNAGVHTAEVARVGGTLYTFLSIDPGTAQLVIVDLSDPANPSEVLVRPMGNPFVHDVFVRDGILFTALWNSGMTIWDLGGAGRGGSPSNPIQLGNVVTVGGAAHNIFWFHDPVSGSKKYAFVGQEGPAAIGSSSSGDIHVVDVTDFASPREVAFFHVAGAGTHNFSVDEARGILYAAYYNGGVRAIDIRADLGSCTAQQRAPDGRCNLGLMGRELAKGLTSEPNVFVWGVHFTGSHVYASDMLNGLWKLGAVTR